MTLAWPFHQTPIFYMVWFQVCPSYQASPYVNNMTHHFTYLFFFILVFKHVQENLVLGTLYAEQYIVQCTGD